LLGYSSLTASEIETAIRQLAKALCRSGLDPR